ncbi:hypothetical protein [Streptomyces sp. NPDC086519]|uniref:hypothetical protein n=1 Tax=Streptomyces sp. NPDC086519 TaxID=3154863 RepID=UPI00343BF47D
MTRRTGEAPHHNNLTCYTDYGCRRPECVERKNQWQRELRRKKREGQPTLIDAEPVRQHILNLQEAGTNTYRIALLSGVNDWTVRAFLPAKGGCRTRKHTTSPDIARRILAVTAEAAASGYTNNVGTHRRIQALGAAGWLLVTMAEPLGVHPRYISDLMRREDRPVYAATAAKVARGYEQLKTRKPPRQDPRAVKRIREQAAAERWPTIAYWNSRMDVIDDPDFEPMYGITRRLIIAQDANEVMRFAGLDRQAAADRLGVHKSYLDHAFRDHPEYAVDVAA